MHLHIKIIQREWQLLSDVYFGDFVSITECIKSESKLGRSKLVVPVVRFNTKKSLFDSGIKHIWGRGLKYRLQRRNM